MQVAGAVDLMVYDAANPRSVIYQLDRLFHHLADLPAQSPAQRLGDGAAGARTTTMLRLTDRPAGWPPQMPMRPAARARPALHPGGWPAGPIAGQPPPHFFAHERLSAPRRLAAPPIRHAR